MTRKSVQSMVDDAMEEIVTYELDEARELYGQPDVVFVDLRDIRELEREGTIPGAFHAPRGMLEFWVDPASPYHKKVFSEPGKRYVLFCAMGWRSALSTLTMLQMGIEDVGHVDGGFTAWKAAGLPVAPLPPRKPRTAPAEGAGGAADGGPASS